MPPNGTRHTLTIFGVNSGGSRDSAGIPATYERLKNNLLVTLSEGKSEKERALRENIRALTQNAEAWLSQLKSQNSLTDALTANPGTAQSQAGATVLTGALTAIKDAEATRIRGNDLARETNGQLQSVCGLGPLPIYSD